MELFGVKLAEASKLFGKKFAAGASITKNAMDKDQIEVCCCPAWLMRAHGWLAYPAYQLAGLASAVQNHNARLSS